MDPTAEKTAEAGLLIERAAEWLAGEAVRAMASVSDLDSDRWRVSGLDDAGHELPAGRAERGIESTVDFLTVEEGGGHLAVRGDHPTCAAVGLYRAAELDHAWFVITDSRVAVLRLRDAQDASEGEIQAILEEAKRERSLGGAIRGVGKIVKSSSTEFVKRARRGPLAGRPEDAVFECPFEVPRFALETIDRWKQPMVPEFKGGPRFVKIGFTDASWARVKTDEDGLTALIGPDA